MFWLGLLIGICAGSFVTLLVIYFAYRIGEMNKEEEWHDELVLKEMEQLRAIREDKG